MLLGSAPISDNVVSLPDASGDLTFPERGKGFPHETNFRKWGSYVCSQVGFILLFTVRGEPVEPPFRVGQIKALGGVSTQELFLGNPI